MSGRSAKRFLRRAAVFLGFAGVATAARAKQSGRGSAMLARARRLGT